MTHISLKLQSRIDRFRDNISLAEIASDDGVKIRTIYNALYEAKVITSTYLIDELLQAMQRKGLPEFQREYPFSLVCPAHYREYFLTPKTRRLRGYRSDLASPTGKIAIEVDGGIHLPGGGAHATDREKRNAYAICGWRLLYYDTDMILDNLDGCVEQVRLAIVSTDKPQLTLFGGS